MKKYKMSSPGFQNTVTRILSSKNQGWVSLCVFKLLISILTTFILALGTMFLKVGESSFLTLWKKAFQKGNFVGSLPVPVGGKKGRIWQPWQV